MQLVSSTTSRTALVLVFVLSIIVQPRVFGQGALNPSGPPAPIMKTLDQIEARTSISPAQGTITQPGSYYLTANRAETPLAEALIWVFTNDVTLDLNGFTMTGGLYSQSGIYIRPGSSNVVVRNGTIENFLSGGISAVSGVRCRISNVAILNCALGGIAIGPDGLVTGCNVISNSLFGIQAYGAATVRDCRVLSGSGAGIVMATNGVLENCQARGNSAVGISMADFGVARNCQAAYNNGTGISLGSNCVVSSTLAHHNGNHGILAGDFVSLDHCQAMNNTGMGISVMDGASITDCQVRSNSNNGIETTSNFQIRNSLSQGNGNYGYNTVSSGQLQNCRAELNQSTGILAYQHCQVLNCQAVGNAGSGIQVSHDSLVSGCIASQNGLSGIYILYPYCQVVNNACYANNPGNSTGAAGIYVDDSYNRVEGNHVSFNGNAGIYVNSSYANNVIVRNTVSGNGANNYVVPTPANDLGPVGAAASATSPWANISH